jgi:FkbH-like protein
MPTDKAIEFRDMLDSCDLFDTLTITEEDKRRGQMYKAQADRKKLETEAIDLAGYCRSLEMVLDVRLADDFSLPRIAQLTQKTNQFNLTTRRYNEADIRSFMESDKSDVIYLRLSDRFGDSGVIGACILKYEDSNALIDTLLLSCRVLGRGVEDAFLHQVLELAKKRSNKRVVGIYSATSKNGQVQAFYPKHGFKDLAGSLPSECSYYFELSEPFPMFPDFFKEIKSEIHPKG